MFRRILNRFLDKKTMLGRWSLKDDSKAKITSHWANTDNCGDCGDPKSNQETIEREMSRDKSESRESDESKIKK